MSYLAYINGHQLELSDSSIIAYTKQVNDLARLDNRQSNFTHKFTVPFTANNKRAMEFVYSVGNQSNVPYQKNVFDLIDADTGKHLIYKGWANINQTSKKGYEINVYDGVIDFYIHDNPTINSVSVNQNGQQISVDAKTIETILKENNLSHVDFVKCDIEGGEMSAITELLLDPVVKKIDRWFVEVHQTNRDQTAWPGNLQFNRQKLIDRFIKSGYQAVEITNDTIFAWQD